VLKWITLIEIPGQPLIEKREVCLTRFIWADYNIFNKEENIKYHKQLVD